ncbi:MAG: RNA-guided endonuclease TnpB family protein [Prevotella sp.]
MYVAYKVRLYPTKKQAELIDKTIGCCRYVYNHSLADRIDFYEKFKDNKDALNTYKYHTIKSLRDDLPWLKEVSSSAIRQSQLDLDKSYTNFFRRVKQGQKPGFPKFKKKGKCQDSYRECQNTNTIRLEDNSTKLTLPKLGKVKIRGLSKDFSGAIKNVTVSRSKSGKYYASILVEKEQTEKRKRVSDNIVGVDLGLKEFAVCSNGDFIYGIKDKVARLDVKIRKQQKHLSRKVQGSNRWYDCKRQLNVLYEYRQNYLNHFQWHLANKLCSENQAISLEDLNVSGMRKNRKLSHGIQNVNWSSFVTKLEQKAKQYGTTVYKVDRFFPSSKTCSRCGKIKKYLKLSDRIYKCDCGFEIDRDLNAAINIKNEFLKSAEHVDNRHGEVVRPRRLVYKPQGSFIEVSTNSL